MPRTVVVTITITHERQVTDQLYEDYEVHDVEDEDREAYLHDAIAENVEEDGDWEIYMTEGVVRFNVEFQGEDDSDG